MAGKMYEVAFKLGAKSDSTIGKVFKGAQASIEALGKGMTNFQATSKKMDAWKSLGKGVLDTTQKLDDAKKNMLRLGQAMDSTANPTAKLKREYDAAAQKVTALGTKLQSQRTELRGVSEALKSAGVNTANFGKEQERLNQQIAKLGTLKAQIQQNQQNQTARDENKTRGQEIKGQIKGMWSSVLAVGAPIALAANYEKELNKARAIGSLSAEDTARQDKLYKRLGAETEYSSSEAARTGVAMSRAGFNTTQIEQGLPAIMDMATASDMGLEQSASILGDTMNAFGLDATQMGHAADVLAKSANIANTDVALLGETFKYVAPSAKTLGISMEEVGAMAGIMADAGIKGTMGGTALREMMSSMAAPTSEAEKAMKKLGLQTKDADGNMLNMQSILKNLNKAMKGMGSAEKLGYLNDIAGKRGGTALMSLVDSIDTGKLQGKLNSVMDSGGYAQDTAAIMREGIIGAYNGLKSAIEGVGLALVTGDMKKEFAAQVDSMAKWVGGVAKWISENPKLVGTLMDLAKTFVTVKLSVLSAMYVWTKIKGVWLAGKAVILGVRTSLLLAKGGMAAARAAGMEGTFVVKAWTAATKLASLAQKGLGAAIGALASPMGLTIMAIGGLVAAGVWLYKNWDMVKEKLGAAWDWMKEKGAAAADWLSEKWHSSTSWASDTWDGAKNAAAGAAGWVAEQWSSIDWSGIGAGLAGAWDSTKNAAASAAGWVADRWRSIDWSDIWNSFMASMTSLPSKAASSLSGLWDTMKTSSTVWISEIPDKFVEMIKAIPSKISEGLSALGKYIKDALVDAFTFDIKWPWESGAPAAAPAKTSAIDRFSGHAKGGIVDRPQLSMIGEENNREYIIPAEGTNKGRGLALWQAAGKDLGVPSLKELNGSDIGALHDRLGKNFDSAVPGYKAPDFDILGSVGKIADGVGRGLSTAAVLGFIASKTKMPIPNPLTWGLSGLMGSTVLTPPAPKEQGAVVINFTNNITLASSNQKEDVLAAIKEAIAILEAKFNAYVNTKVSSDTGEEYRLSFR